MRVFGLPVARGRGSRDERRHHVRGYVVVLALRRRAVAPGAV
jgi:hypothetical protein